jgi:predicted ribosomally synthesized peptide with SipW-like signal peptide
MKKIIISLAMIAAVGALAIGATTAFFSDTETSTGNTFTAGAIDLKVDSQCTYNGVASNQCGVWGQTAPTDITNEKFFNFADLKPGDQGENTISLHVINNDARACVIFDNMMNDDNELTEPESQLDSTGGVGQGELAQELNVFAWADDGDNVWEPGLNEQPLFSNVYGPASDVLNGKSYDLGTLAGATTRYIGLYWCYGAIGGTTSGPLTCSGSAVTNLSQTDSLTGDISFYVEQARNNPNFACPAARQNTQVVYINDLQPTWDTIVYSAYYWPNSSDLSNGVSPGSTAIYDGRQAGIIKAGITPNGVNYEDEGLLGFQVPSVAIATFAGQALTYDVQNQSGPNPVWVRIRLVGGTQYQFVPTTNPAGWHTVNAAAGQWQLMDNDGNATGSMLTLAQVAANNPGAQVDRVYLTLGIGNSYNVSSGVGTVGWVDKVTIGGVTYDFVIN